MLTHFIVQFQDMTVVNITSDLIRKIFKYWEVLQFMVETSFPKF